MSILFIGITTQAMPITKIDNNKTSIISKVEATPSTNAEFLSPKGSTQELYQDVFVTLLMPYIDKELNNFYKQYLTQIPGLSFHHIDIENVSRPNGDRTAEFLITLRLRPYVGPHIVVGTDRIIIRVSVGSTPIIEKFEHISNSELPEHYQDIIIKKPPEK